MDLDSKDWVEITIALITALAIILQVYVMIRQTKILTEQNAIQKLHYYPSLATKRLAINTEFLLIEIYNYGTTTIKEIRYFINFDKIVDRKNIIINTTYNLTPNNSIILSFSLPKATQDAVSNILNNPNLGYIKIQFATEYKSILLEKHHNIELIKLALTNNQSDLGVYKKFKQAIAVGDETNEQIKQNLKEIFTI